MLNRTFLVLLVCYALLQSSCSQHVCRTVRVGDKKMEVHFTEKIEGKNNYSFRQFYVPNAANIFVPKPDTNTEIRMMIDPVTLEEKIAPPEGYNVYYDLGEVSRAKLKAAISNRLRGTLKIREIGIKAMLENDVERANVYLITPTKQAGKERAFEIIDTLPANTKLVLDITFVTIPPRILGGIENMCVLTLTD